MAERISVVARRFGLSRSALLHYDRIGLLRPSGRTASGHREYAATDLSKLERICELRRLGLGLDDIAQVIGGRGDVRTRLLRLRLEHIERELAQLRHQKALVQRLIGGAPTWPVERLDKAMWVGILRSAGLDDAAMWAWHAAFEAHAPVAHQAFLQTLGIPLREIRRVRQRSAAMRSGRSTKGT